MRLACEVAEAHGFEALVGRAAQATLDRAGKMGMDDRDIAVLMKIRENELGIQVCQATASPVTTA